MPAKPKNPPTIRRAFRHPWPELSYLCRKIHYWIYDRRRRTYALRYLERLKRTLDEVPKSRLAILRQEGLALFFELTGDARRSLRHRRREIQLMQRLYRSITKDQDKKSIAYMLQDRDKSAFAERLAIAKDLEKRVRQRTSPPSKLRPKSAAAQHRPTRRGLTSL